MKILLLLCVLVALFLNTACSAKPEPSPTPEKKAPAQPSAPLAPAATTADPGQEVSYAYDGAGICLTLPADWDYEIDAHDAEVGQFSIRFWPEAQPAAVLELFHYGSPFGVCGTGLTTREVAFANGRTGSMGTYSDLDNWSYIAFEDDYVAQNEGIGLWWDAYGAQTLDILGTAVFGEEAAQ